MPSRKQVQLEGMKLILRIARLEPFKSMIVQRSCPVELDEEELSDEALKAHILAKSETIYHRASSPVSRSQPRLTPRLFDFPATSSCRMGLFDLATRHSEVRLTHIRLS